LFEDSVNRCQHRDTGSLSDWRFTHGRHNLLQCPPGRILHVHQPQAAIGQHTLVEDTHDVFVIQLSQRLRFGPPIGRDFQRDKSLQRTLPSQINGRERPLSQPQQDVEIVDPLARFELRNSPLSRSEHRGRDHRLANAEQVRKC
jgi:hypothetical protein